MRYVKKYESKEDKFEIVSPILDHFGLKWGHDYVYKNNEISFKENVNLSGYKMPNGIFPIKIADSYDLTMKNCGLVSFENFPDVVYSSIDVKYNFIKNMKYFPSLISQRNTILDISHNEIEDLIGIPVELMLINKVKYGDLDREILDKYWDYQLESGAMNIEDLLIKLKLSRNTIKNNTVSSKCKVGQYVQAKQRAKKIGMWDLK